MRRGLGRNAVNFAVFQAGWFACVLGAAYGRPWIGPGFAAAAVAVHLWLTPDRRAAELGLVAAVALLGFAVDSVWAAAGVIEFAPGGGRWGWLPAWFAALWLLFATTVDASMAWIQRWPKTAALAGAVAGPACYAAGERLGALVLGSGAVAAVAATWAIVLPLAGRFAAGFASRRSAEHALDRPAGAGHCDRHRRGPRLGRRRKQVP